MSATLTNAVRAALAPLAVAGLCAASVAGLADAAREGDGFAAYDPAVSSAVVVGRSPLILTVARTATWLGSATGVITLAVLVVLGLALHARTGGADPSSRWGSGAAGVVTTHGWWSVTRAASAWLAAALAGSLAWTIAIKTLVARQRPAGWMVAGPAAQGYAFPSGHTLNVGVLAGVATALVFWRVRSAAVRVAVTLVAGAVVLAVGASRVYLGYHWLSDVVAGVLVAIGWLALLLVPLRLRSAWATRW